jgi:hypothetical protein
MSILKFDDGVEIDKTGNYRITKKKDGLYVVGQGFCAYVDSYHEGQELINELSEVTINSYYEWHTLPKGSTVTYSFLFQDFLVHSLKGCEIAERAKIEAIYVEGDLVRGDKDFIDDLVHNFFENWAIDYKMNLGFVD